MRQQVSSKHEEKARVRGGEVSYESDERTSIHGLSSNTSMTCSSLNESTRGQRTTSGVATPAREHRVEDENPFSRDEDAGASRLLKLFFRAGIHCNARACSFLWREKGGGRQSKNIAARTRCAETLFVLPDERQVSEFVLPFLSLFFAALVHCVAATSASLLHLYYLCFPSGRLRFPSVSELFFWFACWGRERLAACRDKALLSCGRWAVHSRTCSRCPWRAFSLRSCRRPGYALSWLIGPARSSLACVLSVVTSHSCQSCFLAPCALETFSFSPGDTAFLSITHNRARVSDNSSRSPSFPWMFFTLMFGRPRPSSWPLSHFAS